MPERGKKGWTWKSKTGKEIDETEIPQVEWLVEPWIARGEIHVLVGDGATGKSYVLLDIAAGLCLGQSVLTGFRVGKPCRVLYVDQDSGGIQTQRRWQELVAGRAASGATELASFVLVDEDFLQLDQDQSVGQLTSLAEQFRPDLVIMDALRAFHSSEENSSTVLGTIFRLVLRPFVRKHNLAVIIAHHTSKPGRDNFGNLIQRSAGEAARGSTEIRNGADTTMMLSLDRKDPGIRILELDKTRNLFDDEKPPPLAFTAEREVDEDTGVTTTSLVRAEVSVGTRGRNPIDAAVDEILVLLSEKDGPVYLSNLIEGLPGLQKKLYSKRTLQAALKGLVEQKRLIWTPEGRRALYALVG